MVTYVILVTSGLGEAIIKQANAIISILSCFSLISSYVILFHSLFSDVSAVDAAFFRLFY
jgi:hypothetical protein